LKTSDAKFILKHNERVVAASFYRAENKLATITTDGIITLWDINNGGMVGRIETNNDNSITSLVYTEDGIIIIYDNGNIVMYDPLNIKEPKTRSVPEGSIEKFVYSHEGKRMIFGILDKTAIRSGGGTSVVIKAPGTTEYLRDDRIKETEIFNRRLVSVGFYANKNFKDIVLPNNAVRSVDSDSMSSYRRTGDDLMDNMNEMNERSYRMRVEQLERSFELTSIAISPDEIIACGLYNGEIIIYDGKTNRELHRFQNSDDNAVLSLAFSPNGRYLLSGSLDRIIRLWDRENNWSMVTQRSLVQTDSLFFSPNNDSFIAKRDYSFFVVNARNGSVLRTIEDSRVKSIFYTENNEIIIIGIENQSVLVW
jgi:WD40 repeat protein